MKSTLCILTIFGILGVHAQQASSPPSAPPGAFAPPKTAPSQASPANPPLAPPPAVPGTPGFTEQSPVVGISNNTVVGLTNSGALTNAFTGIFTNEFGTNFVGTQLGSALTVLQSDIQQTLGLIAAMNGNVEALQAAGIINTGTTAAAASANLSQSFAGNAAANLGVNLGANVAAPTVSQSQPVSGLTAGSNSTPAAAALSTPPTGVTNALGLSTSFGASNLSSGNSGQLLLLQNDLQRIMSEIAALNSAGVNLSATNEPPVQRLTPTGR